MWISVLIVGFFLALIFYGCMMYCSEPSWWVLKYIFRGVGMCFMTFGFIGLIYSVFIGGILSW